MPFESVVGAAEPVLDAEVCGAEGFVKKRVIVAVSSWPAVRSMVIGTAGL